MTQALAAGALRLREHRRRYRWRRRRGRGNLKAYIVAQHVFEKPGGFSVLLGG